MVTNTAALAWLAGSVLIAAPALVGLEATAGAQTAAKREAVREGMFRPQGRGD